VGVVVSRRKHSDKSTVFEADDIFTGVDVITDLKNFHWTGFYVTAYSENGLLTVSQLLSQTLKVCTNSR
jgi:hypothetical protein